MITCTLKDKKYAVDFISGRALREMEPAAKMYAQIVALSNAAVKGEEIPQEEQISVTDAMDVMIRWFCLLFGNQFGPDDVLDGYPVDRLMHDIALALMAVQTQTTEILSQFPTKAAKEPASPPKTAEEIPLYRRCLSSSTLPTTHFWNPAGVWMKSTAWICRDF